MALTVTTANNTPYPAPQIVAPARVVEVARNLGSPGADRALAVTSPRLTIDLRGCNFSLFGTPPNQEFAFNTGTMALTLNQEVLIANGLSPCAQGVGHSMRRFMSVTTRRSSPACPPRSRTILRCKPSFAISSAFRAKTST